MTSLVLSAATIYVIILLIMSVSSGDQQGNENYKESQRPLRWQKGPFLVSWLSKRNSEPTEAENPLESSNGETDTPQRRFKKAWSRAFGGVAIESPMEINSSPNILEDSYEEISEPAPLEFMPSSKGDYQGLMIIDHADDFALDHALLASLVSDTISSPDHKPIARQYLNDSLETKTNITTEQAKSSRSVARNFSSPAEIPYEIRGKKPESILSRPVTATERSEVIEGQYEPNPEIRADGPKATRSSATHVGVILASRPTPTTPTTDDYSTQYQAPVEVAKPESAPLNYEPLYSISAPKSSTFFKAAWPLEPMVSRLPDGPDNQEELLMLSEESVYGDLYRRAIRGGFFGGLATIFVIVVVSIVS